MYKVNKANYGSSIFDIILRSKVLGKVLAPIFLLFSTLRVTLYKVLNSRVPIYNERDKLRKRFSEYFNNYWDNPKYKTDDYEVEIAKSLNISSVFPEESYSLYFASLNKEGLRLFIKNSVFLEVCYQVFYSKDLCRKEKENLDIKIMSIENDFIDIYNFNPLMGYDIFFIFERLNNSPVVFSILNNQTFTEKLHNLFKEKFPYYKISGFYINA